MDKLSHTKYKNENLSMQKEETIMKLHDWLENSYMFLFFSYALRIIMILWLIKVVRIDFTIIFSTLIFLS